MSKLVIFDFGRTLFDNERGAFFSEVRDVLAYLKSRGYLLAIVSYVDLKRGSTPELRMAALRRANLLELFESVLFTTVSPGDKDRLYKETLGKLGVVLPVSRPDQVVIVDDHRYRGIRWGNSVEGVTTVWLCRGKFAGLPKLPGEKEPDRTITALEQLKTIFR